ncbi:SLBB domain-containing protein [Iodidimonas sp. SYSU 1G8]|uniref:SLBB domain-containing protein n=1 Tax=Iodidimonas sp. SYSU 1G8 TaxID=3133967 RepID=UPI0031FF1C39
MGLAIACVSSIAPPAHAQYDTQRTQQNDYQDQQRGANGERSRNTYRDRDRDNASDTETLTTPLVSGPVEISGDRLLDADLSPLDRATPAKPAEPGEFERYVERQLGRKVIRFGSNLLVPQSRDFAVSPSTTIPPSYMVNPGDWLSVRSTGSVEANFDVKVDRDGTVFIPTVGRVKVAGTRYADLQGVVSKSMGTRYRKFDVTVTIPKLRGMRVYVTGYANQPGAYTVSSLSTLVNAVLAAGGPSGGGSFRSIQLIRAGNLIKEFDLYTLLRSGDQSQDVVLENEDVIVIPPVGFQIAVSGSINEEAIYEAKPGESIADVIDRYAGGLNSLANAERVLLYRVEYLQTVGSREITMAEAAAMPVQTGDIVQILSVGSIARPLEQQAVLVRIDGEVQRPGDYYVAPNTPMRDVVVMAGGLTDKAFVYGTKFRRVSVREQQRESYQEAINQLEIALLSAPLRGNDLMDAGAAARQQAAAQAVLAKLRETQPDGRIVLSMVPGAATLPSTMTLENNDHIYIPPRPTTVGVFGAVYRAGSFELDMSLEVRELVDRAGGATRTADKGSIFLLRANGDVIPKNRGALKEMLLPGDLVFVPVKAQYSSAWSKIRDISVIVGQLGLGAAAFAVLAQ